MSTYLTKLHEKTDKYSIAYKHFIVSWKSKNSLDDLFHFFFPQGTKGNVGAMGVRGRSGRKV